MRAARALIVAAVLFVATGSGRADDAKPAAEPIAPTCSPTPAPACCSEKSSLLSAHIREWLASHHCCSEKKACRGSKCRGSHEHFWAWLTYRPETRPCCCPRFCWPCADERPPTWAYFMEGCNGAGCNHTWNGSSCKSCGTCSTCGRKCDKDSPSTCGDGHCHFLANLCKKQCDKESRASADTPVKEEVKTASK